MRILVITKDFEITEWEWECYSLEQLGHYIDLEYDIETVKEIIILEY